MRSIIEYLETRWQIVPAKIKTVTSKPTAGVKLINFQISEAQIPNQTRAAR